MITFDKICEQVAKDCKSLSKKELEEKIVTWKLNPALEIYVEVLQKEYNSRK